MAISLTGRQIGRNKQDFQDMVMTDLKFDTHCFQPVQGRRRKAVCCLCRRITQPEKN